MSQSKKVEPGKYIYGGFTIEKAKFEQMWYATTTIDSTVILGRTLAGYKAAIDSHNTRFVAMRL